MIAFKVFHNGVELCVAGIGDLGVLMTNVTWVHSLTHRADPDGVPAEHTKLSMSVGGLHTPSGEFHDWDVPDLVVGDTVTIQVIETNDITPHDTARPIPESTGLQGEQTM